MRSVRLHARNDIRLHEEPAPIPGPGETLVRIGTVGICGSDLHWFAEGEIGDAKLQQPLVLGHEFAGEIVDGPRKGQRIAIDPAIPCGRCEFCLRGDHNLCPNGRFSGHGLQDGALREYIAWPDKLLFSLPDTLSLEDGAMLEPLGVAIHAVDLGKLQPGMTVGVFGAGPIGLLVQQVARLSSLQAIYVTDVLPHRIEAAFNFKATQAILDSEGSSSKEILDATGGRGLDVAFEAAGENAAVNAACQSLKPGGCLVLIGVPAGDRTEFTASVARRKGLTIKLVRRMKDTYPRAIHLVESGQVDVRSLVTHRFPLKDSQRAFALAARREGLKTVILP